jgi:hypothetical protein
MLAFACRSPTRKIRHILTRSLAWISLLPASLPSRAFEGGGGSKDGQGSREALPDTAEGQDSTERHRTPGVRLLPDIAQICGICAYTRENRASVDTDRILAPLLPIQSHHHPYYHTTPPITSSTQISRNFDLSPGSEKYGRGQLMRWVTSAMTADLPSSGPDRHRSTTSLPRIASRSCTLPDFASSTQNVTDLSPDIVERAPIPFARSFR